jgi:hypothetical protein
VRSCWVADELTSSIQLNLCLAAASGLESWGLALLLGLVILCQLCAAAFPVAGLAAVATSSPVTFAVAAVGTAATAALANARRDGGGRSQSSGSRKSRKAKAGTFPSLRRPRAGFQRSVPCKPLGVAGDSPASSSKPVPRSGTYPARGRAGFRWFFPYSLLAVCVRAGLRTNRQVAFNLTCALQQRRGSSPGGWRSSASSSCHCCAPPERTSQASQAPASQRSLHTQPLA